MTTNQTKVIALKVWSTIRLAYNERQVRLARRWIHRQHGLQVKDSLGDIPLHELTQTIEKAWTKFGLQGNVEPILLTFGGQCPRRELGVAYP